MKPARRSRLAQIGGQVNWSRQRLAQEAESGAQSQQRPRCSRWPAIQGPRERKREWRFAGDLLAAIIERAGGQEGPIDKVESLNRRLRARVGRPVASAGRQECGCARSPWPPAARRRDGESQRNRIGAKHAGRRLRKTRPGAGTDALLQPSPPSPKPPPPKPKPQQQSERTRRTEPPSIC